LKNFLENSDIPGWEEIRYNLLDSSISDLNQYIKEMSKEQRARYIRIKQSNLIKMYSLPFYYSNSPCRCNGPKEELLNFTIDGPEQNYNLGDGPYAEEIRQIAGPLINCCELPFFSRTKSILPSSLHTGWFFFYKPEARIEEPKGHGFDTIMIHMLLNNMISGSFSMEVNGERREYNKRGECFIFNGALPHGADCSGNATFLSFAHNQHAES
jgi:hypothetical protein